MAFILSQNLQTILNTSLVLLLCFFFTSHIRSPSILTTTAATGTAECTAFQKISSHYTKCHYINTHPPCVSQGYLNYLKLFYCTCGSSPFLGYSLLALWLLILFYVLGNTASHYFCSSVEGLSRVLRLSPTIAGVTLLSLGNGSPDVFASIVSFQSGAGEVGLSSVLGGAFFVSCVVVGVINLCATDPSLRIDRASFIRDVCFFILVLSSLLAILVVGRINMLGSICFTLLYFVYVFVVSATHLCREKYEEELTVPILIDEPVSSSSALEKAEPIDHHHHHHHHHHQGWLSTITSSSYFRWIIYIIDMPFYLPRRLTIPDVSEERWSRSYTVASAALAPILVATFWTTKRGVLGTSEGHTVYLYGGLVGLVLGLIGLHSTMKAGPPKKSLFPWLAGGFLMSVLWTYIIAEELVGLLVSLGYIFKISPGILGLTVLAWGNSIGDLIANVAMAVHGGQDGAQIAISGCYAGPIFNTLAGLGLSLVVSAWAVHPTPFVIPLVPAVFEILGFMIAGLLWALVILPRKDMRLDKVLGVGLLAIYLCFLSLRLSQSLGLVQF